MKLGLVLFATVAALAATVHGATPCGPVLLPDMNKAFPAGASKTYCDTPGEGAPVSECATNREAVIGIDAGIKAYKVTRRGEVVASIAWMLFESGGWKFNINHTPGTKGQGTRCMMMWEFISEYANFLFPDQYKKLMGTSAATPDTASDAVKTSVIKLVLTNNASFSAAFWFLVTKAPTYHNNNAKLRDGNLEDFKEYVTKAIGTTWTAEREKLWNDVNKAIDDYRDVETKTAWNVRQDTPEFVIMIRPTDEELRDRVSLGLRVRLPKTYPHTVPQISLERGVGLSDAQVAGALDMAKREANTLAGSEMVYELAILLGEYISTNNSAAQAARPSFHQQMVERENAGRRADMEREAALRQRRQLAYAAEQEDLQRLIQEELQKKQQQALSDRQLQKNLSDIADAVHSVAGRWAEGIQLLKFSGTIYLDPQMMRNGRFTTVALEESAVVDPLCSVYDAYPTDLAGASIHLSDRFTVQCFTVTSLHYLTDQGRRQLERVRSRVADLAQIRHQNLVTVYGCHMAVLEERSQNPGIRLWVLSDTLSTHDGSTLEDVLDSCGAIATPQTRNYLRQILLSLVSLHAAGFTHRGIMPSNIMLTKEAKGKFVAKLFNTSYREELIELHRMTPLSDAIPDGVGNDLRVSPEVMERADLMGRKNDIWCAAVVGLQMVLGLDALRGVAIGHEPDVLEANRDAMPSALYRVLAMMFTVDHRHRPTAMEVLNDPFFNQGLAGEHSMHRQALDSASRGLTFEIQRTARITDGAETLPPTDSDGAAAAVTDNAAAVARPFFSVAQKNIAGKVGAVPGNPQLPVAPAISTVAVPRQRSPGDMPGVEHFMQPYASRYHTDFEEVEFLGKGGFGSVVKARNKIDGRYYAIKKIKLDARDTEGNKKIFREVTTLSRLHHQNVVRYYTTWVETLDVSEKMEDIPEEESEGLGGNISSGIDASFPSFGASTSLISWSTNDNEFEASSSSSSGSDSDSSDSDQDRNDDAEMSSSHFISFDYGDESGSGNGATSSSGIGALDSLSPGTDTDAQAHSKSGRGANVFSAIRFGTMGAGADTPNKRERSRAVALFKPRRELPLRVFGNDLTDDAHATTEEAESMSEVSEKVQPPKKAPAHSKLNDKPREHPGLNRGKLAGSAGARRKESKQPAVRQKKQKILYIQMEYCENKTLNDVIKEGLDEKECWRLFGQILDGLNHIHQRGVIHRDLKPVNTFLDGIGDIKIGDFGLATSSFAPMDNSVSRHVSLDRSAEDAMTADIGTSTYVAPEVTTKGSGATRYNQKVDMYSLGIIFFEMCYPLNTAMERANVLHNLRRPEIVFPSDFPVEKMQLQYQIIRRLLDHNPRSRLSSAELLESDMMPPKMEDEYIRDTIKTIANPSQPYFAKLLESLFALSTDKHIDATYDYRSNDIQAEQLNTVFLDRIRELMTRVFRTHAAVELSTPALTPKTDLLDMYQRPALYLDPKGNVVQLPYDQTVPFARYVARTKMTEIKRYCFDRYYVANAVGGQPVSYTAASFDQVTNRSAHAVAAAEVISVACEVFDELPAFRNMPTVLMINHMCILDAILAYCGIMHPEWTVATDRRQNSGTDDSVRVADFANEARPEDKQRQAQFVRNVCFCLGSLYKEKSLQIRQRIQVMSLSTGVKLHSQSLDRLQMFMSIRGDLNTVQREVLARIGSECGMAGTAYAVRGAEYVQDVVRAFNELRYVEATVRHFGRAIPFVYAPLFNHHYSYYEGGYAFQIMTDRSPAKAKHPQVLAVGGRYDGLLTRFRHLAGNYSLPDKGNADSDAATLAAANAERKVRDKAPEAGATAAAAILAPKDPNGKPAGELSSMSFARRLGSVHSTDVWREIYKGGDSSVDGEPISPSSTMIGTNLSAGSAVLGTARDVVCVGVQIQLDLVIQEMARYQQQILLTAETSLHPTFGLWTRKRCDVVVASFGTRPMLKERIALARELWANNLRTDFLFNDDPEMTMERLVEICRDQGMNWIVTLKRKAAGKRRGADISVALEKGGKGFSAGGVLLPDSKYVYKVKNILRRVECEVPRESLSEWLLMDIQEQHRLDLNTHDVKGSGAVGLLGDSVGLRHHGRQHLGAGLAHSVAKLGTGPPGSGGAGSGSSKDGSGANVGSQQQFSGLVGAASSNPSGSTGSGSAAGSGAGRLELVVVNPQQSTKNLNRSKHKQKLLLTERATLSVNRIMSEAKTAPVLVFELGDELLRRLGGEPSILTDAGYKRIMELCSANQRAYIVELRSFMERYKREGCTYVWLYSAKSDCAATYKL
ncbi:eukaryotic translation initiation factor 2-alpha kinase [Coemansia sp. S610]|nr:eukaryotic translation initiation factor 2-alpha kinase [Coemansia sp. S610]